MMQATGIGFACGWVALGGTVAEAATTVFFDSSQVGLHIRSDATSDTISSCGYLFVCTRDKLFTGGYGQAEPIGRPIRVPWPLGLEAQAVTAGPSPGKARITIRRSDGRGFDLSAFTARLLSNTAGAGGSIEIMPILNGEDAFDDPVYFTATGVAGNSFSYDTTPSYLGSTLKLKGFEAYKITLYVDFAVTRLVLGSLVVPGDVDGDLDVDGDDVARFEQCASGPAVPLTTGCEAEDLDFDNDVDQDDFGLLQRCCSGPQTPADPACGG